MLLVDEFWIVCMGKIEKMRHSYHMALFRTEARRSGGSKERKLLSASAQDSLWRHGRVEATLEFSIPGQMCAKSEVFRRDNGERAH
jgi:hypothetical protein